MMTTKMMVKMLMKMIFFRNDITYSRGYILVANLVGMSIIPLTTLIILNSCIFASIRLATKAHNRVSSRRRRDYKVIGLLSI